MSLLKRNSNILWRRSGDNMLLFSLKTGSLWRLNVTGARIWELLDGEHTTKGIVKIITNEFVRANEQSVRKGLESFLIGLKDRELLENMP